jgi:transposase
VAACQQPEASIAQIAQNHGLNANLVHKWIRAARQQDTASTSPAFLPIALPTPSAQQQVPSSGESIRIEIPRADGSLVVNWPLVDGDRCLRWLQDLLR